MIYKPHNSVPGVRYPVTIIITTIITINMIKSNIYMTYITCKTITSQSSPNHNHHHCQHHKHHHIGTLVTIKIIISFVNNHAHIPTRFQISLKIIKIFVMIVTVTNYMFPGGVECVWWARTSTGKTFLFDKNIF